MQKLIWLQKKLIRFETEFNFISRVVCHVSAALKSSLLERMRLQFMYGPALVNLHLIAYIRNASKQKTLSVRRNVSHPHLRSA